MWNEIPLEVCQNLIESIARGLEAVISHPEIFTSLAVSDISLTDLHVFSMSKAGLSPQHT